MLTLAQTVSLQIEKPAAGGRMIARAGGQVVLVAGAIPGERARVTIERVAKGVAYGRAVAIEEPSPDRRPPFADPLCGGCLYAHIVYDRQLALKAEIIADALTRIGRIVWPEPIGVAASSDRGYRLRARLHLRGGRIGFFREGSHQLCDARATRQLLPETSDVLDRLATHVRPLSTMDAEIEMAENLDASERVMHIESGAALPPAALTGIADDSALTGTTVGRPGDLGSAVTVVSGSPYLTDVLRLDGHEISLGRHVLSFFQGNRFLLGEFVSFVVGQIASGHDVIDLYAGVGLFSIAAARVRNARVTSVEGDRGAAVDLGANAGATGGAVTAVHQSVEAFVARRRPPPGAIIVDPPRTGMSRESVDGVIRLAARAVIYVSCDVATLARDARRLMDAGYAVRRIQGFDLFPNTPHVETVVTFERVS